MGADLKLNQAGMRELLRSPGVTADLRRRAAAVAAQAGEGFASDASSSGKRARATVWTDTVKAKLAEAKDRRLTRAFDAARR